ncbi:MAG TPA: replication-associated recombination protein A [Candidatus Cloacimonadota bacterium]|nr:replication-associated recombination protein A [Candidatus Cloacimonadota bacterium]
MAEDQQYIPLSEKYRPKLIENVIGQDHLLQQDSILKSMISTGIFHSLILWGPPGSGKTTLARLIESFTHFPFIAFSAVLSGIKEVKEVMKTAEANMQISHQPTILFIDEIHRFNRSQQDAFLPFVESGSIILIGATTENPSFFIISALLSRCHVLVLNGLAEAEIRVIISNIIKAEEKEADFTEGALDLIVALSGGDARKAINIIDILLKQSNLAKPYQREFLEKYLAKKAMLYDKSGEEHYNLISALHKSLRGSDPQAGLYWLARMLESGEDPMYIVRRLTRFAAEDIGLADPQALLQAIAVKEAVHFIGMPECNVHLSQLVVYLATAPKSNAMETAYIKAREDAHKTGHLPVPLHIRNAPTKLMKDLNYGKEYQYDHDHKYHYYYQKYFPDQMPEKQYYTPSEFGFERDIQKRIDWWKKLRQDQEKKK